MNVTVALGGKRGVEVTVEVEDSYAPDLCHDMCNRAVGTALALWHGYAVDVDTPEQQ